MRVRANARYVYDPCMLDIIDPPVGVASGQLKPGQVVRVVNLPSCPKCNTMGHAHIAADTNDYVPVFLGLVSTSSLHKRGNVS